MKRLLLLVLLVALPALGQNYSELLQRARAQDPTLDFVALRTAFTQTEGFTPLDYDEETHDALVKAIQAKDFAKATQLVNTLLEHSFVDLEAHVLAYQIAREQNDQAGASLHEYMVKGLAKAIGDSGDGKSTRTAWKVIHAREPYIWTLMLGGKVQGTSDKTEDGHHYQVLTVTTEGNPQKREVFFNVDVPFAWMDQNVK